MNDLIFKSIQIANEAILQLEKISDYKIDSS
jgi:hypothetical protein